MSRLFTRLSTGLFALFVAGGLTFGATQALGATATHTCGDDPGELGLCPPFSDPSCNFACFQQFGTFGGCGATEEPGVICCICAV